jgi:hypothetical protein
MTKRSNILQTKLANSEQEFQILLVDCLHQAANGRWGLFDQVTPIDPEGRIWNWPEAKRAKVLADEIQTLNQSFGTSNAICYEFQRLRSLQGSNILGESRLASQLLKFIRAAEVNAQQLP